MFQFQTSRASCLVSSVTLILLALECSNTAADVDSGCPSWGCLPWGSFSLSAGVPSLNCSVAWRVETEAIPANSPLSTGQVARSCVSDQQTVVCTTQSGYVSIDPTNGKKLWNYTTRSAPYLPIMDIYGDVIGMDIEAMYYVGADGKPQTPISVGILKPPYSLMVGNNSIMLLTGSTNQTAQIVTYLTDGIVDAAIPLRGSIERTNGTFIPFSQPIIAGSRAYIMTYFFPDDVGSEEAKQVTGMLRLYALDLLRQLAPRIVVAWYFNFGKWSGSNSLLAPRQTGLEPIVTYFDGKVYVNVPEGLQSKEKLSVKQPWPGTLWAVHDDGNGSSLVFRTSCFYGPMAVYDTYDNPMSKSDRAREGGDEHLVWIMNRSPAMIQGYDSVTGKVAPIKGFVKIFEEIPGWITSSLSITRSESSPNNDQLIFATADGSTGQARITVVEVDSAGQVRLVWSRLVSKSGGDGGGDSGDGTMTSVEGQIVNFAFYPPAGDKGGHRYRHYKDTWKLGLIAMVAEINSTSTTRSVVGIF